MNKKLLLILPVIIILCSFASAAIIDNQNAYFRFDTNTSDQVSGTASTPSGTSNTTGIIGSAQQYGGSDDNIDLNLKTIAANDFTVNLWLYPTDATTDKYFLNQYLGSDAGRVTAYIESDGSKSFRFSIGTAKVISSDGSVALNAWQMVTVTRSGSNLSIHVNKDFDGSISNSQAIYQGADTILGTLSVLDNDFLGKIDEYATWDRALSQAEIDFLYNSGAPNSEQQYSYESIPVIEVNDSVESTAVVKQTGSITLLGPTPVTITSSSFNITGATTDLYGAYSINVNPSASNELTCRIYIDGNIEATKVRSNVAGEIGNMFIMTSLFNLSVGNHTQELECARSTGPGQITISESVGVGHFMRDEFGREIVHNETIINNTVTSGSSFTQIGAFNITVGNISAEGDKYNSIVIESALEFINNDASPELLSAYMSLNESFNCSTYLRDVGAGNTGSVSMDCILENVTTNQTYEVKIFGNGTNAEYVGTVIGKSFYLSDEEILGGTGTIVGLGFNGSTNVRLFNGTGGNVNHDLANAFNKISYSIITNADTEVTFFFKLINSETFISKNFTRDFENNTVGVLIGQDSFISVPKDNYSIELWANCGGANCTIVGGSSLGYITDVTTTLLNQFNITAWNAWNDTQIMVFNATDGATFSTTNGIIEYFTNEDDESINISSIDYLNQTFIDHNTSQNLNVSLFQSNTYIHTKQKFSNVTINNARLVAEGNTIDTTNGTLYLTPNIGPLNYTINSSSYFDLSDTITITESVNVTVNLWNSQTRINIINASDSIAIPEFNITLTYGSVTETYVTINGTAYFNLTQNLTYNITADAAGFYSNSFTITPNTATYQENFELIKIGNLEIRVFDSADAEPITQLVNFTLTSPTTQTDFNFTGGNFTATGLVEGTQYSLVFNTEDYSEASFLITYSENLAKDIFNVFMSKNAVDITFTVLETSGDIIQSANVQVSGFVNGTLEVVAEKVTDGVGQVRFNLMPDEPYFFVFSKDDYITNNVNIVTFNTEYSITMQRVNVVDFDGPASNVLFNYEPKAETLYVDPDPLGNLTLFNWTIVPQENATIEEFGIELYFNGSLVVSNSLNTPTGGNIFLSWRLRPYINESIEIKYYFIKENFTRYELVIPYNVRSINDISEIEGSWLELRAWAQENLSERDKIVTWVIFVMFMGVLIYLFSNQNANITFFGSLVTGSIAVYILGFGAITAMIFYCLLLTMFIVYFADQKKKGLL